MRAAVVTSFDSPPTCREFPAPIPEGPHQVVVDVLAAGLHPRVRSQADGSHYTSDDELPLIPGIDGVGRAPDGTLHYFILPDTTMGAMAEQTLIDTRRSILLPADADPIQIAAVMNPAMSSWVALRRRIDLPPGASVLILGATGNAGRLAVQVARHFGAGRIIGAGRHPQRLAELGRLGADDTVSLAGDPTAISRELGRVAADVDVVIDYLWGDPTADAMTAIVTQRTDRGRSLTWIEVGSITGPTAAIPSAALRACRLQLVGSGQGSVPNADFLVELPALAEQIAIGTFRTEVQVVPLADVEEAWRDTETAARVVIAP